MIVREAAPAKVNLLLHVGPARADGLHELCSLFASIDLADEVMVDATARRDMFVCAGVEGPNLAEQAVAVFRGAAGAAAPMHVAVEITKRIPVAAGLGGGSADAAAVLRALNQLTGEPLGAADLNRLAMGLGADVPSQLAPRHALVTGAGEEVAPIQLPSMALVLAPQDQGLATQSVYAEADRIGATREQLDSGAVRALAGLPLTELADGLENDLQAAALSLRPELESPIAALRDAGALTALITGSGPTAFGVFADRALAEEAASSVPGGLVTTLRA